MPVLLRGCDCSQSAGRHRRAHLRRAAVRVERPPCGLRSVRWKYSSPCCFRSARNALPGTKLTICWVGPWPSTSPQRLAASRKCDGRSFGEGRVPARGGATKEVRRVGSGISNRPRTVSLSTHTIRIKRTHPPCRAPSGRTPVNDQHLTLAAPKRALVQRSRGVALLHHSDQGSTYAGGIKPRGRFPRGRRHRTYGRAQTPSEPRSDVTSHRA